MGISTKNAKVVAISLGSLQRLISLKAVPHSAVEMIVKAAGEAVSQGVDIQLRVLQTLLGLVTNFREVNGDLLGDVSPVFVLLTPPHQTLITPPLHTGPPPLLQTPRIPHSSSILNSSGNPPPTSYVHSR
jgi:hypothetical protein